MDAILSADVLSKYEAIGKPFPLIVTIALSLIIYYALQSSRSNVPLADLGDKSLSFGQSTKQNFVSKANKVVSAWFKSNPNKPIRVLGDVGQITVLPPSMANEIRNDKRLSFAQFTFKAFHGHLPGFEAFKSGTDGNNLVQTIITKDLTKRLNKITEPLATETAMTLEQLFTDETEWHTISMRESVLRLVARISSRIFLGSELCRNEEWLRITRDYTVVGFLAAEELRLWPAFLRPVVHWFLPGCQKLRREVQQARSIIQGAVSRRRQHEKELLAAGQEIPVYDDAIEWLERAAAAKSIHCDLPASQLGLSLAAIHTTTDLLTQVLTRICQNSGILEPLRKEIKLALQEDGWNKNSLFKMKLLDSVIKESQRMKPTEIVSMTRFATDDVKLSDGTFIPKNTSLAVSSHRMWDPSFHTNPDQWDGYRFYNMREEAGKESFSQLVAISPDHLAFGYGQNACPGRFFASNEAKIALVQIILKYDFELEEGAEPHICKHGFVLSGDPTLNLRIRRRVEDSAV